MKDMFLCLMLNLGKFGNIKQAAFYSKDFSEVKLENDDGEYTISIMRRDVEGKENA